MSNKKKQLVFVGLSGGVDSAVATYLLKKDYNVVGVFMKCWAPKVPFQDDKEHPIGCGWEKDEEDARQVASSLEIPFYSWDFTKEYKEKVIDYFIEGYKAGVTPNPDIECNREIKFKMFLKKALKMGADFVATGHYARVACNSKLSTFKFQLLKGIDENKDQSYFLWTLGQEQLKYCLFPIGEYLKPEIRKIAKKIDLPVKDKPDSQGVCFMGKINVEEFLKQNIKSKPGQVVTIEGEKIGEHEGLETYTIGQRRGIKIGGGIPYFVIAKDFKKDELIVAKGRKNNALFGNKLRADYLSWVSGKEPKMPIECQAKIRYRQPDQLCKVSKDGEDALSVVFKEDQRAITPGQSIVFYDGNELVGGGIII